MLIMLLLLHGIRHYNYMILPQAFTGNSPTLVYVTTIPFRSEGPVVLKNHEGCISSCSFSKDGQHFIILNMYNNVRLSIGSLLVSGGCDLNVNIYNTAVNKLKLGLKVWHCNMVNTSFCEF